MISFYLFGGVVYAVLLVLLAQSWPKKKLEKHQRVERKSISLVIPFRNEQANGVNLGRQLALIQQHISEIVLVDDHSTDSSYSLFESFLGQIPNLKLLKSPGIGKKAALDFGISHSKEEFIVTSDADCEFSATWLEALTNPFSNQKVQLVAGPVMAMARGGNLFAKFQQIEWASILLVTQFSFQKSNPLMCSGANLAFRRVAFEVVGGYEGSYQFLSGDDAFLLEKVSSHFGNESCVYVPFREALVSTTSLHFWSELIQQRVRWSSKWNKHGKRHQLTAIMAGLFPAFWIGSLGLLLLGKAGIAGFLILWLLKLSVDFFALSRVLESLEISCSKPDYLLTSLLHPLYVLLVIFGVLQGKFTWKERDNRSLLNFKPKIKSA